MAKPLAVATTDGQLRPPASQLPAGPGSRIGSGSTVHGPSGPGAVARPSFHGTVLSTVSMMSTQVPSGATNPVETSAPAAVNGTSSLVSAGSFAAGAHVTPSCETRCGTSTRPGHAENTFANMCSRPSASMTAPGLMYRSSRPTSRRVTTGSLPEKVKAIDAG